MLKSDLINILVAKRGMTQKQAEATIETIFESMKEALCRGENIEIRGLGAFHVKNYQGYQGRNPKTGQVIPVKPKRGLLFRTGKELRDRVNRPAPQTAAGRHLLQPQERQRQQLLAGPLSASCGTARRAARAGGSAGPGRARRRSAPPRRGTRPRTACAAGAARPAR